MSKRAFKNASVSKKCRRLLEALVDSVSVRFKNAHVSENNAFKHSYIVECGNRLRVGVRAKNAIAACRGLRVGPSEPPTADALATGEPSTGHTAGEG